MKAPEQYFPVLLFFTLCKVVLTFESVYEILKCNQNAIYSLIIRSISYALTLYLLQSRENKRDVLATHAFYAPPDIATASPGSVISSKF